MSHHMRRVCKYLYAFITDHNVCSVFSDIMSFIFFLGGRSFFRVWTHQQSEWNRYFPRLATSSFLLRNQTGRETHHPWPSTERRGVKRVGAGEANCCLSFHSKYRERLDVEWTVMSWTVGCHWIFRWCPKICGCPCH